MTYGTLLTIVVLIFLFYEMGTKFHALCASQDYTETMITGKGKCFDNLKACSKYKALY